MNSKPKIYLFLSVDVIGSTAIKYENKIDSSENLDWVTEIISFYDVFEEVLSEKIEAKKRIYNLNNSDELITWKYSGDEILFYINISEDNQILEIIDAFASTLEEMADPRKSNKLSFKGTAWLGQVPFIDIEFTNSKNNNLTDFIGTSIDCGFRLGKHASKVDLIISMEIAYLYSISQCEFKRGITFLKREKLKGVLGEFEYPIFAVKLGIKHPEQDLTDVVKNSILKKYIEELIKSKELKQFVEAEKISLVKKNIKKYLKKFNEKSEIVAAKYHGIKTFDEIKDIENSAIESMPSDNKDFTGLKKSLQLDI